MQASRRAELQAKKDKIEELRRLKKAREEAKLAAATAVGAPVFAVTSDRGAHMLIHPMAEGNKSYPPKVEERS